jgi:hypothetical protein
MSNRQILNEFCCVVGLIAFGLLGVAQAEELPVGVLAEIPKSASIAQWRQLYSWVDGSYQSVQLALFNPGLTLPAQIMAPTWSAMRNTDPVATGYGTRGGVGFIIPTGDISHVVSDVRVQLTASYVSAGAMQPGEPSRAGTDFRLYESTNLGCGAVISCFSGSGSATNFNSWQTELKGATDLNFGRIVVSPSMALFAKDAQSQQAIFLGTAYSGWSEFGGKIAIDSTIELTNHSLFGVGAGIGTAYRATSFSSAPLGDASLGPIAPSTATANSRPLLANTEASFIWKPQVWQTIKLYAGMQFDSRTPLAPDSFGGLDPGTGGSGAITFETVRNFYFGSSFKVRFD